MIAESLASAVEPVTVALTSPDTFNAFMLRLGWTSNGFIAPVQNLGSIASSLLQLVENGLDASQAPQAISQIVNFFNAVEGLSSASGLPATINAGEFTADFPQQLTDYLVANYLLTQQPVLGAMLLAGGVITRTQKPAAGLRPAYERLDIAWGAVGDLLHDALATLRNAYGWGTPNFAQQLFIDNVDALGRALGLPVFTQPIGAPLKAILDEGASSTTFLQDSSLRWRIVGNSVGGASIEAGLDLFVLPPTGSALPGVALSPYVTGLAGLTIDLTDTLSLILKAVFDITKGVLLSVRPGQAIAVQTNLSGSPAVAGDFSATLQLQSEDGTKTVVLGSSAGSRFEYSALNLTVGARTDSNGQSFYAEAAVLDGDIVISPGADADGFIAKLLPSDLQLDASVTVGLDSRLGVYFSGSAGLEIEIPAHISLGPIEILSATISVKPAGGSVPIALGASFQGSLGPLSAEVDDIGFTVTLTFPGSGGNLGPVNAALRLQTAQRRGTVGRRRRRDGRRLSLHRYRSRRVRGRAAAGDRRFPLGRGDRPDLDQDARRLARLFAADHPDRGLRRRAPARLRLHAARGRRPARAEPHDALPAADGRRAHQRHPEHHVPAGRDRQRAADHQRPARDSSRRSRARS